MRSRFSPEIGAWRQKMCQLVEKGPKMGSDYIGPAKEHESARLLTGKI
jgi:hypothetical protein